MYSEVVIGGLFLCEDESKRFRRARVLTATEGDEFAVFYVDYGDTSFVSVRKLKHLPEAVAIFKEFARKCVMVQHPSDCDCQAHEIFEVS